MTADLTPTALMSSNVAVDNRPREADAAFAALAARARAGDAEAFDRLMVLTQRKVVATAWRMLGNREDARDAAQETFLRAYRYLDRYDPAQDFQGWLHRITVNVCRDAARRRIVRGEQPGALDAERELEALAAVPAEDGADAAILRAQERALVARALASLPEKERAALVLRDIEDLPTEEVARLLGSRPVTVRSQICSARAKVRKYCERILRGKVAR